MTRIASVTILYNPEMEVLENLKTYINQVDKLFIIDNSENINQVFVEKIQSINRLEYIWNKTNIGIAAALNIGVKRALYEGYEYLLTMDQDSQAPANMVSDLLECFSQDFTIAIVSPLHHSPKSKEKKNESTDAFTQVFTVWTSGNLVKLSIFKTVDGYKEDFFIDYVDHEICLRLKSLGYKIYTANKIILKHNLGKIEEVNLIFRKVYPTNHSPLRLYYRTRNRFYVKNIYKKIFPEFFEEDDRAFWKSYLKVVLFEKNRVQKIKYIIRGYRDYRRNIFGKYEDVHSK